MDNMNNNSESTAEVTMVQPIDQKELETNNASLEAVVVIESATEEEHALTVTCTSEEVTTPEANPIEDEILTMPETVMSEKVFTPVQQPKQIHVRTILERDLYTQRQSEKPKQIDPYRNSNGESEGLTIGLGQLTQFGVDVTTLKHGDRLKLALVVEGIEKLPLLKCHINKKGVYVTGKIVTYHEQMGHLPTRIKMGDKRRGVEYRLMVDHIVWEQPVTLLTPAPEIATTGDTNINS